jgi:ATP/ADP translocase
MPSQPGPLLVVGVFLLWLVATLATAVLRRGKWMSALLVSGAVACAGLFLLGLRAAEADEDGTTLFGLAFLIASVWKYVAAAFLMPLLAYAAADWLHERRARAASEGKS